MKYILGFFILFGFFNSSTVFAATGGFTIVPSNESPRPGETLTLDIKGFSFDINRSDISWYLNGREISSGIGQRSIRITAPAYGVEAKYSVVILTTNERFDLAYTLSQNDVDLIFEAENSFVPPFYKGRPLPVKEGMVKVSAIPNITESQKLKNPKDFVYNWEQNNLNQANFSGYGKNYFLYKNSYFNQKDTISLESYDENGSSRSNASITVNLYNPKILFYEKHPTKGVLFNKNISDGIDLPNNSDFTFVAYPLFFSSTNAKDRDFVYSWEINQGDISTPSKVNEFTIRTNPNPGSSQIGLTIDSISRLYQKAEESFYVTY